jgi:hypothetical protein
MTISSDIHLITKSMLFLFFPSYDDPADITEDALGKIWDAQANYECSHTRVILTEVPGVDPFTTTLPRPDSIIDGETPLSIAHMALMGGILDEDMETFDTPIIKLTIT